MKKCPFCAEDIQEQAVKCKHCGEFLTLEAKNLRCGDSLKWYFKTSVLVLGFLCAGPLMLPLIWFHPRYKRFTKIVLTVIIIFISFFAVKMFLHFWNIVKDYYQVIFSGELKAF